MEDSSEHPVWKDLAILVLAISLLYLGFSWMRPLASPDEPRYSEIPREMVASGDWVTPRLNGVLYFYKPPLFYWAQALSYQVGGDNRFLLRFWPAACGILGCVAVYLAGRRLFDRRTAVCAAVILATSILYFALSQLIILDMMVSVLMAGALLAFLVGMVEPPGPRRRYLFWSFYALIALGVMTKGIMCILIPGAIIFLWFLLLNQWRNLKNLHLIVGGLIFLVIVLPWHLMIHQRHETWFDFYIIHEHFERYLSDVSNRAQPFWFFLVILPAGLFPWVSVLPSAIREGWRAGWKARTQHRELWFLGIWAAFILFFFSISKSKLIPYILPAYPPLALLLARYWCSSGKSTAKRLGLRFSAAFIIVGGIAIPLAGFIQEREGRLAGDGTVWFPVAAFVLIAIGIWWLWLSRASRSGDVFWQMVAGCGIGALLFNPLAALFQPPSPEALVKELRTHLSEGDFVGIYLDYLHAVPFYLESPVAVLDCRPGEQSFGLEWEDHSDRYRTLQSMKERWDRGDEKIYVIMKHGGPEYFEMFLPSPHFEFSRDDHFTILTNRPPAP